MDLVSGYKGVVGLVFGNENSGSNEDSYVERLLDRISNGKLAEDRRSAMIELQAIVAESRGAQLAFGAMGFPVMLAVLKEERDDVEMVRGALETLVGALTPIEHAKGPKNEVQPALMNTDLLSREADSISLLLSLLSEEDFYVRYYTLQLLTALLTNSPNRLQEAILTIPCGITRLMDMLMDREVIRNEALLLLTYLTREAEEIQKIVVFEGAFEKIFSIIKEEGGSEGGVVVQDCLQLLNNLLRTNASNQILLRETMGFDPVISILKLRGSTYNFTQQKTINLLSALETINLLMMGGTEADPGKDANKLTNKATLVQKKVLDHLLLLGVESQWAPVTVRCAALQCIGDLISGQPKNLDILATKVLGEEPQMEPALNSILRSWEVYYLNRQLDESTVQNAQMDGFLQYLQDLQKEAAIMEESDLHFYSSKDVDMILNDEDRDTKEGILGSPTDKSQRLYSEPFDSTPQTNGGIFSSGKPFKHVTPFGQRTDKFVVKFSTNNMPDAENRENELVRENNDDDIIRKVQPRERCSLIVHGSGPEPGCRFMYDRIEDRFNALENQIKRHTTALVASGLYEEPVDPTVASQKSIFAVGMICCDGEGHLNEKSILLQSSVEHSGGQRVRLELQKLSQFSVFPGQVVGVEGHNPSGHCLITSKLVDSIPLSTAADVNLHPAKKQALDQEIQSTDLSHKQEELSVIIASGPFTTTDNLSFEPLTELLAYATRKLPQVLILLGPFVDSEHPEIKKGTTDRSFDEIFHVEILRRLQDHVEYMGSNARVILVPSIRDANHDFVFPQPAFEIHSPNLKHQITSLTNPGTFEANQVKIGCCTVDILKHLSGEEMSRNPADGTPIDRMSRLANHILSQRRFYPLYPPAEGIPLDFSLAPESLHISSIPDILILPSDMKYFVKVLSLGEGGEGGEQVKCICVNPGRLAKGEGGGTFAELNYHGGPDTSNASIIGI